MPIGDAFPCSSCGLMITDPEQHHRVGKCRAREPEKCKDCGILKLKNVAHPCSVRLALQQEGSFYHLVKAKAKIPGEKGLSSL